MNRIVTYIGLSLVALLPLTCHAHKAWLLPSATVTTVDQWVTVDAAVSNDLFYFNHVPLRTAGLTVIAPDASKIRPENLSTGKYRTTFDVHLAKNGTYRLANVNHGMFATYQVDGAQQRWRGAPEQFAAQIPANAKNVNVTESLGRVETFVTAGKPTEEALRPANVGLEMVPVTHPNDLYAGEAATFRFVIDGKPAAGLEIEVIAGGTRYRDHQQEIKLTTNAQGEASLTWPAPGMYWLEATSQDNKTSIKQAKERRLSYVATLEVLPQ